MKRIKLVGILVVVSMVLTMVSVCAAADQSFERYGVRLRGIYIMPNEKSAIAGLEVDDAVTPELDLEYFITRNFSAELVLALSKHDITLNGAHVGSTWLLPPSLYVKYHPIPTAKISPYVGFGMNVVMPFDEKLNIGKLDINSSVGWAAKVGVDIKVTDHVYLNIDAMYYDCRPGMKIDGGSEIKLNLNPFIVGTGIGVRF